MGILIKVKFSDFRFLSSFVIVILIINTRSRFMRKTCGYPECNHSFNEWQRAYSARCVDFITICYNSSNSKFQNININWLKSSVSIVSRLSARRPGNRDSIPEKNIFYLLVPFSV